MRTILAIVLSLFGALIAPAFAQAPPPVPALPDTERRTAYAITSQTGPFDVGFQVYGDGTDYSNWLEVWVGSTKLIPITDWTLSLASGTLSTVARPIQNARVTLTVARTGTLQIVGARRPRRLSQFAENQGVSARNLNQVLSDLTAQNRETWDLAARSLHSPPGGLPLFVTGGVVFGGASGDPFQDSAALFWDNTNKRLGIGTASPSASLEVTGNAKIDSATASTSLTTGALVVAGGVGVGGTINAPGVTIDNGVADGGDLKLLSAGNNLWQLDNLSGALRFTSTSVWGNWNSTTGSLALSGATGSTSPTTGALTVAGGLGVGQNINGGGALNISGPVAATGTVRFSGITGGAGCVQADVNGFLSTSGLTCGSGGGGGAVTSVGLSMPAIFSVSGSPITTSGAFTVSANGTSGGIPYFNSATTLASSGVLPANSPVIGGGAGVAPAVGTRSGNSTVFVTTAGAQTSGNCVSIDASGNHIANGSACTTLPVSSASVNNVQPGTGGLTRTSAANFSDVVNLKNFAPGDGTDQTTAIQAAFTYAKSISAAIHVPCGTYGVSGTIDITGVSVIGMGGCSVFSTTANVPILQDNNNVGNFQFLLRENITLQSTNATHTSDHGWSLVGTANTFNYNTFRGIRCAGVSACLYWNKNLNAGGEEATDWNLMTDIQTTNLGAKSTTYGILFQNGSGTGNVISNSNFVVSGAGIYYFANNGANVGDITIVGIQVGGTAVNGCFVFSGSAAYRNNITITATQCDGGPSLSIVATNYNNLKILANSFGGATTYSLTGTSYTVGDFGTAFERRYANRKTVASTTTNAFFNITLPTTAFVSAMIEFVVEGLVQNSGAQIRTSRYHVSSNGSCASITATQLDTFTGGSIGTPFTITSALATCTLTFSTSFPGGTTANSAMTYAARVVGPQFDAVMQ